MPNETAGWSDKSASRITVTYYFYLLVIISSYRGLAVTHDGYGSNRFFTVRAKEKPSSPNKGRHWGMLSTLCWPATIRYLFFFNIFLLSKKIGTPTCDHIVQLALHDRRPPLCLKIFIKHRPPTRTASRLCGTNMCCSAAYYIMI